MAKKRKLHNKDGSLLAKYLPVGGKTIIWHNNKKHIIEDYKLVGFNSYEEMKRGDVEVGSRSIVNQILEMSGEKTVPTHKTNLGKKYLENVQNIEHCYDDDGDFFLGITPKLVKNYILQNLVN